MSVIIEKIKVLKKKYLEVFDGVGKLKRKQISFDIDPGTVKQPIHLKKKVKDLKLLKLDIIEPSIKVPSIETTASGSHLQVLVIVFRLNSKKYSG